MGKKKLDEFHYHEALDRSYLVADMMETMLIEHPVIRKHRNLKIKLQKAQSLVVEVYQEIGGLEITMFPEPSNAVKNENID